MFLKNVLATLVALIIFTVAIFAFFLIGIGIISATGEQPVDIADNSILHLKLDRPILERSIDNPLSDLVMFGGRNAGVGLKELKEAIRRAAEDDRIQGILMEPNFLYAGLGKLYELRKELEKFKETGKFIISYSEYYSESEYYLASVADEVYLPEEGILEFNGFRAEYNFIKGTIEKLGIEAEVFKAGDYKSAVEPFTRTEMSNESREQTSLLLNSFYSTYLADISRTRDVSENQLNNVADSMLATNAKDALKYQLITDTKYFDQVIEELKFRTDLDSTDKLKPIPITPYLTSTSSIHDGSERIAVVFADGEIINGKTNMENIGSESLSRQLRKLRQDDRIKAVVLRINSPGGSSLASDVIWREVLKTSEVKPIIASMSDVAASGGYYIAMACDSIVAQPMTITGSIGVYSMHFSAKELLEDKLGITTDVVKTGLLSDIFTIARPFTEYEKNMFQSSAESTYQTFLKKASSGRGMTVDQIDAIAGGRIWSGTQARDNGLIDALGGLDEAVSMAAAAAGIEQGDYRLRYYPPQKTFIEQIISDLSGGYEESRMKSELGVFYPMVRKIRELQNHQGLQSRLPFDITIQ
ncbi:MAG: signal peptide peptidase SppA [Cyclobacteriaceae bacterium]|nr:MAG: signal peptide peptidase SppA [Cyclobacteriaceae bacterium]